MAYPGSYPAVPGCGRKSPGSYRGVTEQCRDLGVHKAYPGSALVDPGATLLYGVPPAQPGSPLDQPGGEPGVPGV